MLFQYKIYLEHDNGKVEIILIDKTIESAIDRALEIEKAPLRAIYRIDIKTLRI